MLQICNIKRICCKNYHDRINSQSKVELRNHMLMFLPETTPKKKCIYWNAPFGDFHFWHLSMVITIWGATKFICQPRTTELGLHHGLVNYSPGPYLFVLKLKCLSLQLFIWRVQINHLVSTVTKSTDFDLRHAQHWWPNQKISEVTLLHYSIEGAVDSRTGKVYIAVKQTAGPTDILLCCWC